jgi:hypothetical protein
MVTDRDRDRNLQTRTNQQKKKRHELLVKCRAVHELPPSPHPYFRSV